MAKIRRGVIIKRKDGSEVVRYNDPSFPSYIFDGYIIKGCDWERVPHYHEDVERFALRHRDFASKNNLLLFRGGTKGGAPDCSR